MLVNYTQVHACGTAVLPFHFLVSVFTLSSSTNFSNGNGCKYVGKNGIVVV